MKQLDDYVECCDEPLHVAVCISHDCVYVGFLLLTRNAEEADKQTC